MGRFFRHLRAAKHFTAKFIGETYCGFEKGRVYHINIYQDTELRFIWVTDAEGSGCCAYGSLKELAANWECPVKELTAHWTYRNEIFSRKLQK